jgi:hypothetical protein
MRCSKLSCDYRDRHQWIEVTLGDDAERADGREPPTLFAVQFVEMLEDQLSLEHAWEIQIAE